MDANPESTYDLYGYNADIRESASVAHIYGQNLVAAESLTASSGAWAWSPATLKPTADKELAMGLNRFVIHTSVHQPLLDRKPGLALGPFGQWFTRNETWAEQAAPWIQYLARSCYLLQQGHFAADIVYFYGEDSNLTALFGKNGPGHSWRIQLRLCQRRCADSYPVMLKTDSSRLERACAITCLRSDPHGQHMSLPVLRKVRDLVRSGALVAGPKPTDTPSLSDDPQEFQRIVDELWGSGAGEKYCTVKAECVLRIRMSAEVMYVTIQITVLDLRVRQTARRYPGPFRPSQSSLTEISISSTTATTAMMTLEATFRVTGKEAELWHADTSLTEPVSFPNRRWPHDRASSPGALGNGIRRIPEKLRRNLVTQLCPKRLRPTARSRRWKVPGISAFRPIAAQHRRRSLWRSWPRGVNAPTRELSTFSGTGTYTEDNSSPAGLVCQVGAHLLLDLGEVKNLAEVFINGKSLGIVWKTPYRIDVTSALTPS